MRISANVSDPDYYMNHFTSEPRVYLDGDRQHVWLEVDDEESFVSRHESGSILPVRTNGAVVIEGTRR